jgi:hypothetical protein
VALADDLDDPLVRERPRRDVEHKEQRDVEMQGLTTR